MADTFKPDEVCPRERSYSRRRYAYAFGVTIFCLALDAWLVLQGYTGQLAEKFVSDSLSLIGTVALLYLGAGVIDRSRVLEKIGDRFSGDRGVVREETYQHTIRRPPPPEFSTRGPPTVSVDDALTSDRARAIDASVRRKG